MHSYDKCCYFDSWCGGTAVKRWTKFNLEKSMLIKEGAEKSVLDTEFLVSGQLRLLLFERKMVIASRHGCHQIEESSEWYLAVP